MPILDLAAAKRWLKIPSTDTSEDADLADAIASAESMIERFTLRRFGIAAADETERFTGNRSLLVFPRRFPIGTITRLTVNGAEVAPRVAGDAVGRRDFGRFSDGADIQLVHRSGEAAPADVVLAAKVTVQAIRNAPGLDPNLLSDNSGIFSGTVHQGGAGTLPPAAQTLLTPLIRVVS